MVWTEAGQTASTTASKNHELQTGIRSQFLLALSVAHRVAGGPKEHLDRKQRGPAASALCRSAWGGACGGLARSPSRAWLSDWCRISDPRGQHLNKTDSAIRATHGATGLSVRVQSERSQHANKRLAVLLLRCKLDAWQAERLAGEEAKRHKLRKQVDRGNPVRVIRAV